MTGRGLKTCSVRADTRDNGRDAARPVDHVRGRAAQHACSPPCGVDDVRAPNPRGNGRRRAPSPLGLLGLLAGDRVDSFGSFGGSGLDGVYLGNLVLGIGLVMRKELARRVYLVFAVIGLVLTVISSSSYTGSFTSYALGVALDVITIALLVHPSVRHTFD
jgi:hypothetical protein